MTLANRALNLVEGKFKLTPGIFNKAKKLGFLLDVDDFEWGKGEGPFLCIYDEEGDSEPWAVYRMEPDKLIFHGNVALPPEIKEELPATIFSTNQLLDVLRFLSNELKGRQ